MSLRPLFGLRYCVAAARNDALAQESFRARNLEARVHEAELRLAEKPACPKPPPTSKPSPKPVPAPYPPEPKADEEEQLKIPEKIAELEGCWESIRGDMPIVTDDKEQRPVGNVRKCYCFDGAGHGVIKLLYTDGARCRSRITAKIAGTLLEVHQPHFGCRWKGGDRGLVRSETTCHAGDDETAICDTENLGRLHTIVKGDHYRRVPKDHCG